MEMKVYPREILRNHVKAIGAAQKKVTPKVWWTDFSVFYILPVLIALIITSLKLSIALPQVSGLVALIALGIIALCMFLITLRLKMRKKEAFREDPTATSILDGLFHDALYSLFIAVVASLLSIIPIEQGYAGRILIFVFTALGIHYFFIIFRIISGLGRLYTIAETYSKED